MRLQRVAWISGRIVTPHAVDEPRDRLFPTPVEKEDRQQPSPGGTGDRDRPPVHHLQRPQNAKVDPLLHDRQGYRRPTCVASAWDLSIGPGIIFGMRRVLVIVVGIVLAACGGGTDGLAVIANTQQTLTPGPNRILLAVATEDGGFVSRPDTPTVATFTHETAGEVTVDTEWVWAIPNVRGFHVAYVDFPEPGRWNVVIQPEDGPPTVTTPFGVQTSSPVPDIGDPAIPVATRTHPEFPLAEITTDPDPDPRLYELSLDEALGNGRSTVVVFATPAFCQSATCGPTLDVIREVMDGYPALNWLHVEVYENLNAAEGGTLDPVDAIAAWSLPSEPWVFVIDSDGIVTARFEGALGAEELRRALDGLG